MVFNSSPKRILAHHLCFLLPLQQLTLPIPSSTNAPDLSQGFQISFPGLTMEAIVDDGTGTQKGGTSLLTYGLQSFQCGPGPCYAFHASKDTLIKSKNSLFWIYILYMPCSTPRSSVCYLSWCHQDFSPDNVVNDDDLIFC